MNSERGSSNAGCVDMKRIGIIKTCVRGEPCYHPEMASVYLTGVLADTKDMMDLLQVCERKRVRPPEMLSAWELLLLC
jgi:hypothetical protein